MPAQRVSEFAASVVLLSLFAVSCATSEQLPIYTHQPTATPLRYDVNAEGEQTVETPNGPAGGSFDTDAVMLLSLGDAADGGRAFSMVFESFESVLGSQMGEREIDDSPIVGTEFRGVVSPGGAVRMTETPEVQAGAYDQNSLIAMFPDLLAPLPPGGEVTEENWPHAYSLPSGGGLEGETSYTGTARFAGDTIWNGIAAKLIESEGAVHADGKGTPQGAPAEVRLEANGHASARYVWDPASGILLAMAGESTSEGTVTTMGMDLPITLTSSREAALRR